MFLSIFVLFVLITIPCVQSVNYIQLAVKSILRIVTGEEKYNPNEC